MLETLAKGPAVAGALLGGLGVVLGAFGARALRARLDEQALGWWQTGVDYHLWHALAILLFGIIGTRLTVPAWIMAGGILLFSGSLYVMALTGVRVLGAVTPIGGLLLIIGWALAAWRIAQG